MTTGSHAAPEPALDELLLSAARALRRRWATGLGHDLTPHDARALRVVGHHGPTRLGVVAEHLRIAARSATDVIDRLEGRGLVTRSPDPADRRAMTVSLTSRGEAVLTEVDAARRVEAADYFAALSDRERSSLTAILGKLDRVEHAHHGRPHHDRETTGRERSGGERSGGERSGGERGPSA